MVYGFCYTKYKKDGSQYKHCPGYAASKKKSSTSLENKLIRNGFSKKIVKQAAAKIRRSGKSASKYSKITGKLKTRK